MAERLAAILISALTTAVLVAMRVFASKIWVSQPAPVRLRSKFPRGELSNLVVGKDGEASKLSDLPEGWWTSSEILEREAWAIFAQV